MSITQTASDISKETCYFNMFDECTRSCGRVHYEEYNREAKAICDMYVQTVKDPRDLFINTIDDINKQFDNETDESFRVMACSYALQDKCKKTTAAITLNTHEFGKLIVGACYSTDKNAICLHIDFTMETAEDGTVKITDVKPCGDIPPRKTEADEATEAALLASDAAEADPVIFAEFRRRIMDQDAEIKRLKAALHALTAPSV